MTELRAFVRQQARSAAVWAELDSQMGDTVELSRLAASKRAEAEAATAEEAKAARADQRGAQRSRTASSRRRKEEAGQIIAEAQRQSDRADARLRQADEALAKANGDATQIVSAAKDEAARITELIEQLRGKVQ